jgi:acetyl-CoA carboxylase carboxyltransferase component
VSLAEAPPPADSDAVRKLSPRERLEALCDPGTVNVIRSVVRSERMGHKAEEGDGVLTASGSVAGRPVFCFAEDGGYAGGSLGEAHANSILRILHLARDSRAPVVGFVESAGARMQEGTAALAGYARVFRANVELSGRVPQISISTGPSAGGGVYSPALTDFVLMTQASSMFLTGPQVVREVTGEDISTEKLGGAKVHTRNGVAHFEVADELEAALVARELLSYLPQNAWECVPVIETLPAPGANPGACIPRRSGSAYDVREVARRIVDGGHILEVAPRWARNIVTAFARLDGRSVGIVANQPRYLGGVLDAEASQKAARFVRTCNTYGVPLIVLVDTPGFLPGAKQEGIGIIRHGAKLLHAFAQATVPKLTVVLRQAYGGGYITMNSKDLGADFAFAWPRAVIGIMGSKQAVGIISRREIAAAADPETKLAELAEAYAEEHQGALAAAREGVIDEVISPDETRQRLAAALAVLGSKPTGDFAISNIPL